MTAVVVVTAVAGVIDSNCVTAVVVTTLAGVIVLV